MAEGTIFEFADPRTLQMCEAVFAKANFVGATLDDRGARECNWMKRILLE